MDMYNMGGYGCGCGDGLSSKSIGWAVGIGATLGLLASPLGGPILNGIGIGCKYAWKGIAWAGKQIGNTFAYLGKGLWNVVTGKNWSEGNNWDKCHANS